MRINSRLHKKGKILNSGVVVKKTCKYFIHLNSNNNIDKKVIDHNYYHEENEILNRQIVSNRLERKALDDVCEKQSKIINIEYLHNMMYKYVNYIKFAID